MLASDCYYLQMDFKNYLSPQITLNKYYTLEKNNQKKHIISLHKQRFKKAATHSTTNRKIC